MKKTPASQMFPSSQSMYDRYLELKSADPYKRVREEYARNYNRQSWKRKLDPNDKSKDPNFGQFKSKLDNALNMFMGVLTERRMFCRVIPKYAKPGMVKLISDKISEAFHRLYVKPWEDRFILEAYCARDMLMCGKGVEHWPTRGCFRTENVPVENVFPDTNAGLCSTSWSYVFIEKPFTVCELLSMKSEQDEESGKEGYDADTDTEFNQAFLNDILKDIDKYADIPENTEADKDRKGDVENASKDKVIIIVYAYVKDYNKKDMPVSRYVFPAKIKETKKSSGSTTGESQLTANGTERGEKDYDKDMRFLASDEGYCKCISNHVHTRFYQIERSYYRFNSFAKQIYLSTMLYDKSMSMVLRAAKRGMILYWKTADRKSFNKLKEQNDEEMQLVDESTSHMEIRQQTNIQQMVEAVRQLMQDNENGLSMAQAPGSQNVKGYAITAEEASIRNQKQGEAEALNMKILMANDAALYKELYRRAMENDSDEYKEAYKCFKEEMEEMQIEEKFFKFDNVYFSPIYLTGGNQSSRFMNAKAIFDTLLQQASTPGQEAAQREVIGTLAGFENIADFLPDKATPEPAILKAGGENEDLDNPRANPANLQVLPTDKHMVEIPVHLADYEMKLKNASALVQTLQQEGNPFKKAVFIVMVQDLIAAQDNKGGHITGHINSVANDKRNMKMLAPLLDKFKQLQAVQDQLTETIAKIDKEFLESTQQTDINNLEIQHLSNKYKIEEEHLKTKNDLGLAKAVEQKQMGAEKHQQKMAQEADKKGLDLAEQEEKAKLKIAQEEEKTKQQAIKTGMTKPPTTNES